MAELEGRKHLSSCKKALIVAAVIIALIEIHFVSFLESGSSSSRNQHSAYQSNNRSTSEDWPTFPGDHRTNDILTPLPSEQNHSRSTTNGALFQLKNKTAPLENQRNTTQGVATNTTAAESYEEKLEQEISRRLEAASDKKIILIWSLAFGNKDPHANDRKQCGECDVTYDRSLITDERTRAVVFHFDSIRPNDVPKPRNPNQLHIFWAMESSATLKVARGLSLKFEESYKFNATMTHRLDSTYLASYQSPNLANTMMGKDDSVYADIMKEKSKFAIVMISNCGYTNGARIRMRKIKELQKLGLSLDGYGGCFGRKISWKNVPQTVKTYKFYFAYENSNHCRDYVTEKFFHNALSNRAVPVVWGATKEDYEAIAPPGSFIFSDDFDTPKKLIDYLQFLHNNEAEYLKYFKWAVMKPEFLPQYKRTRGFCAICRELHGINADERFSPKYDPSKPFVPMFSDGIYPRTVPSLIKWFYDDDTPECFGR